MNEQKPAIAQVQLPTRGRIVEYCLDEGDVEKIKSLRGDEHGRFNAVSAGMYFPLLIVTVHGGGPEAYVNGRLFLDGEDAPLWVTSVNVGDGQRHFKWPTRV